MGDAVILEFDTAQKAALCLAVIDQLAAPYWAGQGYTVLQTENGAVLIGKNAATGNDDPDGVTRTWDEVRLSPDGTFYIFDPAVEARFSEWESRAAEAGYVLEGVRKIMPENWRGGGD